MAKTFGYLRVSTTDQDLDKNKAAILLLANNKELGQVKFVEEKASGRISWKKRKIADLISSLQKGGFFCIKVRKVPRVFLKCSDYKRVTYFLKLPIFSI